MTGGPRLLARAGGGGATRAGAGPTAALGCGLLRRRRERGRELEGGQVDFRRRSVLSEAGLG
jgi:hypothetical protein